MTIALICATLAILISFSAGWLLARLSMAALLVCMPQNGTAHAHLAERSEQPWN
ncbi:MAG: hypothetical protein KGL59_06180 [Acidobacteriota bacterium]|nr:hypothetical protein [Acidobacteriota bacterium]